MFILLALATRLLTRNDRPRYFKGCVVERIISISCCFSSKTQPAFYICLTNRVGGSNHIHAEQRYCRKYDEELNVISLDIFFSNVTIVSSYRKPNCKTL